MMATMRVVCVKAPKVLRGILRICTGKNCTS